ncbi:hypothetical protein [Streptomyces minutiscleroticus]|nr:hypothetical protein [Streptomyces minutiscleroticus]
MHAERPTIPDLGVSPRTEEEVTLMRALGVALIAAMEEVPENVDAE